MLFSLTTFSCSTDDEPENYVDDHFENMWMCRGAVQEYDYWYNSCSGEGIGIKANAAGGLITIEPNPDAKWTNPAEKKELNPENRHVRLFDIDETLYTPIQLKENEYEAWGYDPETIGDRLIYDTRDFFITYNSDYYDEMIGINYWRTQVEYGDNGEQILYTGFAKLTAHGNKLYIELKSNPSHFRRKIHLTAYEQLEIASNGKINKYDRECMNIDIIQEPEWKEAL